MYNLFFANNTLLLAIVFAIKTNFNYGIKYSPFATVLFNITCFVFVSNVSHATIMILLKRLTQKPYAT